jgi:ribonuclease T2
VAAAGRLLLFTAITGFACYAARMKAVILTLLAVLLAGCPSAEPAAAQSGTGNTSSKSSNQSQSGFDYYLLNLSWSPAFCSTHRSAPECAQHATFVMHGLWPENNDGTYPQSCSNAPGPADPSKYSDVYPDPGLLQHEWQKHGTCSGLSPDDYFTAARKAFQSVTIPSQLAGLTAQTSMAPEDILGLFTAANPGIQRASLTLSCSNNNLSEIEVCLDKSLQPTSCGVVRTCGATVVNIPPP